MIGAAGYGTGPFDLSGHDVCFTYAGFQPGLLLWSDKLVHPRLDVLLGSGLVIASDTGRVVGAAPVLVPRLALELNVSRALHLSGDVGWRIVAAPGDARRDFSGLQAGATLRFGWL